MYFESFFIHCDLNRLNILYKYLQLHVNNFRFTQKTNKKVEKMEKNFNRSDTRT